MSGHEYAIKEIIIASNPRSVPVIVAAGGKGRRMNSNKPLCVLAGKTLINRSLSKASHYGFPVAIAVRIENQFPNFKLPQLVDETAGLGPIGALQSGFRFAGRKDFKHVLMIGCDLPFLPNDLLARLHRQIEGAGVAMPVSRGRDQTMAGLWKVNIPLLEDYIASGSRSLWRFAETIGAVRVDWPLAEECDPFANINDPAALARAEERLRSAKL